MVGVINRFLRRKYKMLTKGRFYPFSEKIFSNNEFKDAQKLLIHPEL